MVFAGGPYVGSHDGDDDGYAGGDDGGVDDGWSSNFGFCGSPAGQTDLGRNLSDWECPSPIQTSQLLYVGGDRTVFGFDRIHLFLFQYVSYQELARIRWRVSDMSSCSNADSRNWENKKNPHHLRLRLPPTLRPTCCNCFVQSAVWNRCSFVIDCFRLLIAASSDPIRSLDRFHFGPTGSNTVKFKLNKCYMLNWSWIEEHGIEEA